MVSCRFMYFRSDQPDCPLCCPCSIGIRWSKGWKTIGASEVSVYRRWLLILGAAEDRYHCSMCTWTQVFTDVCHVSVIATRMGQQGGEECRECWKSAATVAAAAGYNTITRAITEGKSAVYLLSPQIGFVGSTFLLRSFHSLVLLFTIFCMSSFIDCVHNLHMYLQ